VELAEISVRKPTLDQVFLTLTGHGVPDAAASETSTTPAGAATTEGVLA